MTGVGQSESFVRTCARHVRDGAAMRRTVMIALVVGTILTVVNQGDRLAQGEVSALGGLRIAANYLVPWIVSSLGYISARRRSGRAP